MRVVAGWTRVVMLVGAVALVPAHAQADEPEALRYTISVSKFNNEAGWRGQWNLGQAFETMMTDRLQATGRFIVLGDTEMRQAAMQEQDFVASGRTAQGRAAPQMARMTPAQLLVRGTISNVQETGGGDGGVSFRGIRVGGSRASAEINATIYLVNTETGQVMASQAVTGKSGRRGLGVGYYGGALSGLTGDLKGFEQDNVGKATENAIDEAIQFLVAQLTDIQWEGTIVMAGADRIIVNRGEREGIKPGMRFQVGQVEELVDPDTGEVLHRELTTIATLRVTEVRERIAYCEALSGGDKLERGMTVQLMD